MDDEKWNYNIGYKNDEDRIQYLLTVVFEGKKAPLEYALAVLIKSVERLKASTDENRKAVEDLKASTDKSSSEANTLSAAIKRLTARLVWLAVAAVAFAAVSLFLLWKSAN